MPLNTPGTTQSPSENGTSNGTSNGTPRTKICVFCGSHTGIGSAHLEAAREVARIMAKNDIDLVYGGGTIGLMGEVARTLCELQGPDSVHGIIPEPLIRYERNENYQTINEDNQVVPDHSKFGRTTVVKDMHTRKKLMAEEVFNGGPGSGFIALSGGYGTIEELFETVTWNQLGIHKRGICLLNVDGYWDGIIQWVDKAVEQGFIARQNRNVLATATTATDAVSALLNYQGSEGAFKLEWGKQ